MYLRLLKLSIEILFLLSFIEGRVQFPPTPCRSVFNYKVRNGTNEAYGYLKFTNDLTGDYQLEVRMSVARRLPWNIGIFRLPTEDQIQCGADLEYEVTFPPCDGLIPVLTYVKFNNKIYCTGPPERDASGRGTSNFLEYDGLVTDLNENTNCDLQAKNLTELPNQSITENKGQIPVIIQRSVTESVTTPKDIIQPTEDIIQATQDYIKPTQDGCGILQEMNEKVHFPWLATIYSIQPNTNNTVAYYCGGTLISNLHVVTVAHCVDRLIAANTTIRLGRNNIKQITPSNLTTVRTAKNIFIHPTYGMFDLDRASLRRSSTSNIAVIELDHPVEYSELIRPACLWNETDDLTEVVGEQAIVIGWGSDAKPRNITMPIVSRRTCFASNKEFAYLLDPSSFCAGNRDGIVPCIGNSGMGLLLPREGGRYYLRGLTATALIGATGRGCDGYSYNVFTDVAIFVDWILSIVNEAFLN